MNLNDLKVSGNNSVHVEDALPTSLLGLKITINDNTEIPTTNELNIYIDTSLTPTENRKTYTFNLNDKLSVNDKFIMEPVINNKKVELKAYISSSEEIAIEYQNILLFEGSNYIYTNYENATIDIIYPKNIDFVKYYLNNIIYASNNASKILSLDDIYFKDAFTKIDDNINATFNNLNINCLTSLNNKFNLDSDGNLTVNSLTTSISSSETNFDEIYPVGSIYMSVNNTNPSTLFGGTWSQITGRFLLGVGIPDANTDNYFGYMSGITYSAGAGSKGGQDYHTLTVNEMPNHSHYNGCGNFWDWGQGGDRMLIGSGYGYTIGTPDGYYIGGNQAHNNMPPYFAVYIWQRTA